MNSNTRAPPKGNHGSHQSLPQTPPTQLSNPPLLLPPRSPPSTDHCQRPIMAAQQVLYGELQDFQERMQRCLIRCQDRAQESLPAGRAPSESDMKKAQEQLLACMEGCGKEFSGGVPKLRANIEAGLKGIPRA